MMNNNDQNVTLGRWAQQQNGVDRRENLLIRRQEKMQEIANLGNREIKSEDK